MRLNEFIKDLTALCVEDRDPDIDAEAWDIIGVDYISEDNIVRIKFYGDIPDDAFEPVEDKAVTIDSGIFE